MVNLKNRVYTFERDGEVEINIEPDTICINEYTKYDVQNYINSELSSALKRYIKADEKRREVMNKVQTYYLVIFGSEEKNISISVSKGFYKVDVSKYEDRYYVEIKLKKKRK